MAAIKATPTKGLCYSPSDPRYWNEDGLAQEIERIFDVCHGCRLCFNLCPSFPLLFDAVDRYDGDVRRLDEKETEAVVDACYQCKLCYVKCPYTADDGHEFDLDFPRLMLRYTAQRARAKGIGLRQRLLGDPVRLASMAGIAPAMANRVNRARFPRIIAEKLFGIHRDKLLPEFASPTFEAWVRVRNVRVNERGAGNEVVLFHTCFVNYNNPEVGKDAVSVLEHCGFRVLSPEQGCCGMPALDGGDVQGARRRARHNVAALKRFVDAGLLILVINPTCSYALKKEYPDLVGKDLAVEARALAGATRDLCEFLFELKRDGRLARDFRTTPGEVAYHVPCHLKAQNIGFRSRDVLKTIPGVRVRVVERCCGHDGTWAMKRENFESSMRIGKPAFEEMSAGGLMTTDCPLAAVHFEQATGIRPLHPVQVLARAYREDGFDQTVASAEKGGDGG